MTFKDDLLTDAKDVFLDTGEFAVDITITPVGGIAKTIKALVAKPALEPGGDNNRTLNNQMEIHIANDATEGVTSIDKKNDKIDLTDLQGISRTVRVSKIIEVDSGMWHLLVKW